MKIQLILLFLTLIISSCFHHSGEINQFVSTEDTLLIQCKKQRGEGLFRGNALKSWDKEFNLANPEEDYEATDMVSGRKPPRQLIAIFKNQNYFVMTYNHGGWGHHRHIMYFQMNHDKIVDFWVGYGRGRENEMEDKQNIRDWLALKAESLQTNFVEY